MYDFTGDKFTAEIKFLQKWNPAMNVKDGSAYRLFQGNVLDAVSNFSYNTKWQKRKQITLSLQTTVALHCRMKPMDDEGSSGGRGRGAEHGS